jgi:apolipoprotein D and lipocalin family protein
MLKLFREIIIVTGFTIVIISCSSIPKGAVAVSSFEPEKYQGKWYEIARMDFRFERNMNNVTAEYTIRSDGSIKVDNRGYNYVTKEWKQAVGKAKLNGEPGEAKLKVSFFGPFYSGYNVLALDSAYQYALVVGKNVEYMWLLSRKTSMPEDVKQSYLNLAKDLGFNINDLIWVEHNED